MAETTQLQQGGLLKKLADGLGVFFLFLLLSALFYWRIPVRGHAPLFGDVPVQFLPWKMFIKQSFLNGEFPLWNPYSMGGKPFLANMQSAILYPVDFLLLWLPVKWFYAWSLLFHSALAGMATFFFGRHLGLSRFAAIFSGLAFMLSGYMLIHVMAGNTVTVVSSCWIVPVFYGIYLLAEAARKHVPMLKSIVLVALMVFMQTMSGHPQMTFYTMFFASVWIVLLTWGDRKTVVRAIFGWSVAVALAFCFGAMQIVPTMEMALHCSRQQLTFDHASEFSFSLLGLPGLFLPEFSGSHMLGNYWHKWYYWSKAYVGIWAAVGSLLTIPGMRSWIGERFRIKEQNNPLIASAGRTNNSLWLIILLSIFLALGRQNPVYRLVFALPGFSSFRSPVKFLPYATLGMALFGGMGLDWSLRLLVTLREQFFSTNPGLVKKMGTMMGFVLAASLLIWPWRKPIPFEAGESGVMMAAIIQSVIDGGFYLLCGLTVLWCCFRKIFMKRTCYLLFLLLLFSDLYLYGEKYQTFGRPDRFGAETEGVRFLQSDPDVFRIATMADIPDPEIFCVFGLENICGYDPLSLDSYAKMYRKYQGIESEYVDNFVIKGLSEEFFDLLNVKYVLARRDLTSPTLVYRGAGPRFMIFERTQWRPRITARGVGIETNFISRKVNSYAFQYSAEKDTRLSLSHFAYPGWRAFIDGSSVQLEVDERGLYEMQVPEGEHMILILFQPESFYYGLALSVLSFLALSIWLIIRKKRLTVTPSQCKIVI